MEIKLTDYPEVCLKCGSPAKTELNIHDYPVGVEWFQFCINYKCIQFDAANLRCHREQLEKAVKESKPFRRYRQKLWKAASVAYKTEQKRLRALYAH
jgi:hypothetical protein